MVFGPEGFFYINRAHIGELALTQSLPTVFDVRDYVEAGGLASYGSDYYNVMELTGGYAARVRSRGKSPPGGARGAQAHLGADSQSTRWRAQPRSNSPSPVGSG
jgi:hypothetical protein